MLACDMWKEHTVIMDLHPTEQVNRNRSQFEQQKQKEENKKAKTVIVLIPSQPPYRNN